MTPSIALADAYVALRGHADLLLAVRNAADPERVAVLRHDVAENYWPTRRAIFEAQKACAGDERYPVLAALAAKLSTGQGPEWLLAQAELLKAWSEQTEKRDTLPAPAEVCDGCGHPAAEHGDEDRAACAEVLREIAADEVSP